MYARIDNGAIVEWGEQAVQPPLTIRQEFAGPATIQNALGQTVEIIEGETRSVEIVNPEPQRDWRPLVQEWPEFDRVTHQVGNPVDTIEATRVLRTWPVTARALSKADLAAYAAAKRYAVEIGGCSWSGHFVQTDRDSQAKLIAEFVAIGAGLRADPSAWKFANGFAFVSNADMGAVILAARTHIAACFAKEAEVLAAIQDGTMTTTAQIDAAPWPG